MCLQVPCPNLLRYERLASPNVFTPCIAQFCSATEKISSLVLSALVTGNNQALPCRQPLDPIQDNEVHNVILAHVVYRLKQTLDNTPDLMMCYLQ